MVSFSVEPINPHIVDPFLQTGANLSKGRDVPHPSAGCGTSANDRWQMAKPEPTFRMTVADGPCGLKKEGAKNLQGRENNIAMETG